MEEGAPMVRPGLHSSPQLPPRPPAQHPSPVRIHARSGGDAGGGAAEDARLLQGARQRQPEDHGRHQGRRAHQAQRL